MTSSLTSGLLLVVEGCRGVVTMCLSFCNDLLYDEITDWPNRQEITDASDPHAGSETVPAGLDCPT